MIFERVKSLAQRTSAKPSDAKLSVATLKNQETKRLDHEGYQQLDIGDRVSISGEIMDYDFLEGREFVPDSIVTLEE